MVFVYTLVHTLSLIHIYISYGHGQPTERKLINSFREILVVWLIENSYKIGGVVQTVEVDETAFGGVDRQNKKCFLKVVSLTCQADFAK